MAQSIVSAAVPREQRRVRRGAQAFAAFALLLALWDVSAETSAFSVSKARVVLPPTNVHGQPKLDWQLNREKPGETYMAKSAFQTGVLGASPGGLEYKRTKAAEEVQVIIEVKFMFDEIRTTHKFWAKKGHLPPPVTTPYETYAEKASHILNNKMFEGYKMTVMKDRSRRKSRKAYVLGLPSDALSDPEMLIKLRRWFFDKVGAVQYVTDSTGKVVFANENELKKAKKMFDGSWVEGRRIAVEYMQGKKGTLQIRGLHPKTPGSVLLEMFSKAGEVVSAVGPNDVRPRKLNPKWWKNR